MSRLTVNNLDKVAYSPWELCGIDTDCVRDCKDCPINAIYLKLAHYEDLEEQGRLIELPCKVGDVAWIVGTKCLAGYEPDGGCEHHDCDECIYDKEYITFQRRIGSYLAYGMALKREPNFVWGETVFATKAEAEAKLAELKGVGDE